MVKADEIHGAGAWPGWRFRPSAAEWAMLGAGLFLVIRYAWLLDDVYVYYRYVDNLVLHGSGLVWNPGERVEGFSSPLWVLLLAGLRLLRADYWMATLAAGAVCYLAFWWLACLVNRRLAGGESGAPSLNLPLIYLALNYAVACHFTSGLESPLVNLLAAVYAAAVLWPRNPVLLAAVGLSPLVRHEFLVPLLLFMPYARLAGGRTPWAAILACAASLGSYLVFRVWYYADLLPNTFYLKDTAWPRQGLKYLLDTLLPYQTLPFLAGMAALFLWLRRAHGAASLQGRERAVMLLLALPVLAYVVRIGGDARHFRYLAFPFILAVLATGGLAERLGSPRRVPRGLLLAAFALAVLGNYPRQLQQHPLAGQAGFQHSEYMMINDAAFHRYNPVGTTPALPPRYDGIFSARAARARWLRDTAASPGRRTVIARGGCRQAFLRPAWFYIHAWGLTDAYLARTTMPFDRPSHKYGLYRMSRLLSPIRERYGFGAGAFDQALAAAPQPWFVRNIEALRLIERKVCNRHRFRENLGLALRPVPRIRIGQDELPPGPVGGRGVGSVEE